MLGKKCKILQKKQRKIHQNDAKLDKETKNSTK